MGIDIPKDNMLIYQYNPMTTGWAKICSPQNLKALVRKIVAPLPYIYISDFFLDQYYLPE